jgi:caffeoyl-CoA O-methyltransferase
MYFIFIQSILYNQIFNQSLHIIFAKIFALDIIHPQAQEYAEKYTSAESELLTAINQQTRQLHAHGHMVSGHLQGKFLELISCILQPARILEIGTFTGYSALCLAKGLTKDGLLHTIELREEDADTAQRNFNLSDAKDKIFLHRGNAVDIIPRLNEIWDMVFIDADKTNYIEYYKLVLPAVRKGGLILADNVLFHGEVLQEEIKGKNAKAIQAFNEYLNKDERVEKLLLTIRDGLMLIIKK